MRAYLTLVLVFSLFGHAYSLLPLLSLAGIAETVVSQGIADVVVKAIVGNRHSNDNATVGVFPDFGTIFKPNCTTFILVNLLLDPSHVCGGSDNSGRHEKTPDRTLGGHILPTTPSKGKSNGLVPGQGRHKTIKSHHIPAIIQLRPGQTYERTFKLSDYYDLSKLKPGTYQLNFHNHVRYKDPLGISLREIPMSPEPIVFTWPASA